MVFFAILLENGKKCCKLQPRDYEMLPPVANVSQLPSTRSGNKTTVGKGAAIITLKTGCE